MPQVVQLKKGLTREQAVKEGAKKKLKGDFRGFAYDPKTGKATYV